MKKPMEKAIEHGTIILVGFPLDRESKSNHCCKEIRVVLVRFCWNVENCHLSKMKIRFIMFVNQKQFEHNANINLYQYTRVLFWQVVGWIWMVEEFGVWTLNILIRVKLDMDIWFVNFRPGPGMCRMCRYCASWETIRRTCWWNCHRPMKCHTLR